MPMSMRYIVKKLRSIRPAPASSTSVSAIWTTISPPAQRRARMPPDPVRPPSLSISCTLVVDVCSAGISPKIRPVARHTTRKNVNVRQSIENTIQMRDADVLRFEAEPPNPDDRQQQPDDAGNHRQENALDEQLTDDLPAACANGDAHAHLTRSSSCLGQEEVGDVRARDQQHEPDGTEQRPEEQ